MNIEWRYGLSDGVLLLKFSPVSQEQLNKILNMLNEMCNSGETVEGEYKLEEFSW